MAYVIVAQLLGGESERYVMNDTPAYSFRSHIAGRNAQVEVYATHINWQGRPLPLWWRITVIFFSVGFALLSPKFRGRAATNTIPMKAITSVSSSPSRTQSLLRITAPDTVIEGRVAQTEADMIKAYILQRIG